LDTGHIKERPCIWGIEQGKESKTGMWLMCSLYRNEYSNLKLAEATMGGGLGSREEDWWRWTSLCCNIYRYGNNTRNTSV
jgi:hypothetical protein